MQHPNHSKLHNKTRKRSLHSYKPTINKNLVSLKSLKRATLKNCNAVKAFKLKEPLSIYVPTNESSNHCLPYYNPLAIHTLLDRLRANKHIITTHVIPPKQIDGNCWFNTMFMMFFVSDKGRHFFHFFRQFMIEGKDSNKKRIPKNLRDAFSLLNYAVELSLTGSKYAVNMDTNNIIIDIYDNIPKKFKYDRITKRQYVPDWWDAGNPIHYYNAIMRYLNVASVSLMEHNLQHNWLETLTRKIQHKLLNSHHYHRSPNSHSLNNRSIIPHIIVLNGYQKSGIINKLVEFEIVIDANQTIKYQLDSSSVLDDSNEHFSCVLTCEGQEMGFDGMSTSRIRPLQWKDKINQNVNWTFEGSAHSGVQLAWNFQTCYHQMLYYRI